MRRVKQVMMVHSKTSKVGNAGKEVRLLKGSKAGKAGKETQYTTGNDGTHSKASKVGNAGKGPE